MSIIRRAIWTTVLVSLIANPAMAERAAEADFGNGPRTSVTRLYSATLQPTNELRLRQMLTVPVRVVDAQGRPVDDATITVDGGMPEHSHGLPTRPIVRRSLGDGVYEIEGLRFNMRGWWQLRLAIKSPAGSDRVTFDLAL